MTYPTISHLIESLTGVFIPLPIQTFGFFIVTAFILGHYFIKIECLRLEGLNVFKAVKTRLKAFKHGLKSFKSIQSNLNAFKDIQVP